MRKELFLSICMFCLATVVSMQTACKAGDQKGSPNENRKRLELPAPETDDNTPLEKLLEDRRSVREFKNKPLGLKDISLLVWAAQGITDQHTGKRTAPSAGALYPLQIYIAVKNAQNLDAGTYRYLPQKHEIKRLSTTTANKKIARAALGQMFIAQAPISLIITADYSVTTSKYGKKGVRYVHMEAGHAAQNVYLQAEALGLGTVTVGAFIENKIEDTLNLPEEQTPLYIMPVGNPR